MGGPAGLSRVHMGQTVCALRGYPPTRLLPASRAQAALPWTSPLDISMKRCPFSACPRYDRERNMVWGQRGVVEAGVGALSGA
eukprot:3433463-Rhodomonas_salina.4